MWFLLLAIAQASIIQGPAPFGVIVGVSLTIPADPTMAPISTYSDDVFSKEYSVIASGGTGAGMMDLSAYMYADRMEGQGIEFAMSNSFIQSPTQATTAPTEAGYLCHILIPYTFDTPVTFTLTAESMASYTFIPEGNHPSLSGQISSWVDIHAPTDPYTYNWTETQTVPEPASVDLMIVALSILILILPSFGCVPQKYHLYKDRAQVWFEHRSNKPPSTPIWIERDK